MADPIPGTGAVFEGRTKPKARSLVESATEYAQQQLVGLHEYVNQKPGEEGNVGWWAAQRFLDLPPEVGGDLVRKIIDDKKKEALAKRERDQRERERALGVRGEREKIRGAMKGKSTEELALQAKMLAWAKQRGFPADEGVARKAATQKAYEQQFKKEYRKKTKRPTARLLAPLAGRGTEAFPTTAGVERWTKEELEAKPYLALVDPTTNKLLPGAHLILMDEFTEGGTARIGPTQAELTGEYFEDAPEAVRQHLASRQAQFQEDEAVRQGALLGKAHPLDRKTWGKPEEMPGEMVQLEQIGDIQRAGLELPEAVWGMLGEVAGGIKDAVTIDDPEAFGAALLDFVRSTPRAAANVIELVVGTPHHLAQSIAADIASGGELSKKDLTQMFDKFKEHYKEAEERYETDVEKSLGQESWDLMSGMVIGMAHIAKRMGEGVVSGDDIDALSAGFTDGAIEFTAPMVHSMVETVSNPWEMARKRPMEMALNLMMIKAPLVKPLRGRAAALEAEFYAKTAELRAKVAKIEGTPGLGRRGKRFEKYKKQYEAQWGKLTKSEVREMFKNRQRARAEDLILTIDEFKAGTLDKARHLQVVADIIDGAGVLLGDVGFGAAGSGISTISLVRSLYTRTLKGKLGAAPQRWWLAPKDARLPALLRTMHRESAGANKQRLIDLNDALHFIPARFRPVVADFLWMEHEPIFNIDPAKSLVELVRPTATSEGGWRLSRAGREKLGYVEGRELALSEGATGALEVLLDQESWGKRSSEAQLREELARNVGEKWDAHGLTDEQRNLRIEIGSKLAIVNRYGRNLVKVIDEATQEAMDLEMFADPATLRQVYFSAIYREATWVGKTADALKLLVKEGPARGVGLLYEGETASGPAAKLAGTPDGGKFLKNQLRQLQIPIEARMVKLGRTIPNKIIEMAPDGLIELSDDMADWAMETIGEKKYFNPREYLKKRNESGKGGFGMVSGLAENVAQGVTALIWDVEMAKLQKRMAEAPELARDTPAPGFILADNVFLRNGKKLWRSMFEAMVKTNRLDELHARARKLGVAEGLIASSKKGSHKGLLDAMSKKAPRKNGALSGKYLQEDVWMELVNVQKFVDDAAHTFPQIIRKWKIAQTAYSPVTASRNILTNVLLFAPMANVSLLNPLNLPHYMAIINDLRKPMHKRSAAWKEAYKNGVFDAALHKIELGIKKNPITRFNRVRWGTEHAVGDFAWEFFEWTKDISTGRSAGWDVPGHLYGLGDDIFRGAYYYKFRGSLGGLEAAANARKFFVDYESVAGFVQVLRTPFRPMVKRAGHRQAKPGEPDFQWKEEVARESMIGKTLFAVAGQPFLAFTAQALPLMLDWLKANPLKATLYMNLHDYLTRLSQTESGIPEDYVKASLDTAPPWERASYAPAVLVPEMLGLDKKREVDGQAVYPTMDAGWMSPLGIFASREAKIGEMSGTNMLGLSPEGVLDFLQSQGLGANPILSPLLGAFFGHDIQTGRQIYDKSLPRSETWPQAFTYLMARLVPPPTPSPSDVYDLATGELFHQDLLDPSKRKLREMERFGGGRLWEQGRASLLSIPDYKGRMLEWTDFMMRFGGLKLRYSKPSELALYNASITAAKMANAMDWVLKNEGTTGIKQLGDKEGPKFERIRSRIVMRARKYVVQLNDVLRTHSGEATALIDTFLTYEMDQGERGMVTVRRPVTEFLREDLWYENGEPKDSGVGGPLYENFRKIIALARKSAADANAILSAELETQLRGDLELELTEEEETAEPTLEELLED